MAPQEASFSSAICYALVGWLVRLAMYYFNYDSDTEKFNYKKFWDIYDKYIIVGFIGSIALSLLGDTLWYWFIDSWVGEDGAPYNVKINIGVGFFAQLILVFFDRKAKTKFDDQNQK